MERAQVVRRNIPCSTKAFEITEHTKMQIDASGDLTTNIKDWEQLGKPKLYSANTELLA